jgi:hypothetical protein
LLLFLLLFWFVLSDILVLFLILFHMCCFVYPDDEISYFFGGSFINDF